MTPYVTQFIEPYELAQFEEICRVVRELPDLELGFNKDGSRILLSCHILSRAVAMVFELKYVDGFFKPHYQHSWVLNERGNLIDVYPVAMVGGPIMYPHQTLDHNCPSHRLYEKDRLRLKTRNRAFCRALGIVTQEIRRLHGQS